MYKALRTIEEIYMLQAELNTREIKKIRNVRGRKDI